MKLGAQRKPICTHEFLYENIRAHIGDMTFREIYEENGWNLNITAAYSGFSVVQGRRQSELKLMNYLTTPNVVVWSAVMASCSFPGLFPPVDLVQKDKDGLLKPYYTA